MPSTGLPELLDLTRQDWSVHLDEAADWRSDDISDLERLPEREPCGGWGVLDSGRPIRIPASTYDIAPEYQGVSWWSTELELTPGPAILHFVGARLLAEVYVDRRRVHLDLEGMTPFAVRLPAQLGPGRHRLDLRLTDPGGGASWMDWEPIEWGPHRLPASHGFAGPWLPVLLEKPGPVRVTGLCVRSDRELRNALVDFDLEAEVPRRLRVELTGPGGGVGELEVECTAGRHSLVMPLSTVSPYGPGRPNLHTARVIDGDTVVAETRFGLRVLDFDGSVLRLNGEPFRMATSISWGWYRRGPVPSEGDCEREARSVEEFGMNTLSAHRHLSTPALQDALEERGLLLYQEAGGIATTIVGELDERQRRQVEELSLTRLRRLARRDRGRACLAWWNLANEVQAPFLEKHDAFFTAAAGVLREEDGSRLVTFTSGWGESAMWRPFDAERRTAWDWHRVFVWPSAWQEGAAEEVVRFQPDGAGLSLDGESACFVSLGRIREIVRSFGDEAPGGAGRAHWRAWVDALEQGLEHADPEGVLGGVDGVAAGTAAVQTHAVARLIEAHRRVPEIHGLATNGWHQHHRIGTSGIVGPDRSPVGDPEPIRRANAARALALPRLRRAARAGDEIRIEAELLGGPGEEASPVAAEVELEHAGRILARGAAPGPFAPLAAGLYTVRARFEDLIVEDVLMVVDPGRPPSRPVAVWNEEPLLLEWLRSRGVDARRWRIGDGLPMLSVGHSPVGSLPDDLLPARVATIQRSFSTGGAPRVFVIGGVSQLESPQAGWFGVHGAWIGGWGFSASRDLPGLGPPGVWGAERAELYPRTANRQAPGRWLSAAISFPDATGRENGLPAVGATTWRHEHAGRELVTTVLPLLEQRDHPLGEAVLMDLVRWLAEA